MPKGKVLKAPEVSKAEEEPAAGGYDIAEDEMKSVDTVAEEPEKPGILDDGVDSGGESASQLHEEDSQTPEEPQKDSDDFDFSPPRKETGGKKLLWIILILVFLAVGIGGGMFIFKSGMVGGLQATPSPSPTVESTPTPKPELDRSELNIQVLNGSGIAGVAKTAQEFLEGLGYEVGNATNAKTYDYTQTEISLKEEKMDYKDQLISDLSKEYLVSSSVETLDEDSKYDAVVIIGSDKSGEGGGE
ncbi:LytR C-terminal domain-containing protein [Candidatus Microgenomates bacterium]|nr:LytR C-terminal domain-containing protein [Candidatus Microgenomates bacterium]